MDIENPDQLLAWLRDTGRLGEQEQPAVTVLAGGVSNRTVLLERPSGEAWVLKQALAQLRVQVEWFSDPLRIHREANGLRWLHRLAPPGAITPLVFEDHQHHVLAMQAVPSPHDNWKSLLLSGQLHSSHIAQFASILAAIHRQSARRRAELQPVFEDRSFFESLRLEPYYLYTAAQVPEAAAFLQRLVAETRATRLTLTHGDYSPKNILVRQDRLVLLDHEVIHFGEPAFDLGFSLTHLLSKAHHLRRADFLDAANLYWKTYWEGVKEENWAPGLEPRAVRHTLGCLLARVAGRSPLEYMNPEEKARQRGAAVSLLREPPQSIADLAAAFGQACVAAVIGSSRLGP